MSRFKKCFTWFMVLLALTLILPISFGTKKVEAAGSVGLEYSWLNMTQGSTYTLKMKGTSQKVKWSSSNKKVATVTKKGKITAKTGGTCTITAKVGGKKYKCTLKVKGSKKATPSKFKKTTLNMLNLKLDVAKIEYSKDGEPVLTNNKGTFKLKVLNSSKKAKWKTSNAKVATVKNGTVTAVAKGKCTISAVIKGKRYKCAVTVTNLNDAEKISAQENIFEMVSLVNKDRVKKKAAPLKVKEQLNNIADIRATEAKDKFAHTRPNGTSYKTAYADIGFKTGAIVGENLSYTRDKVEYMGNFVNVSYKSLWNSKAHRKIMLNPAYEYIGVGYYNVGTFYDDYGALCVEAYWVQELYKK